MKAIDLGFDIEPSFTPANIDKTGMVLMFKDVPESVKQYARALRDKGWHFYAVSQTRGRCYNRQKVITIPMWVILKKSLEYKTYYIAHEMAHAYDECKHNHDDEFMAWLIKICPEECIHHELEYKPRNAARNGIMLKL